MYRWCVDYKRVIDDVIVANCYSCSSYSEAMNDAEKIWKSINEEEKNNIYTYYIKPEGHFIQQGMKSIHLNVSLMETDNEGKIIDIYKHGVFENEWLYNFYCIMDHDKNEIVEKFDTYIESYNRLKEYSKIKEDYSKYRYTLCTCSGEENSDSYWTVMDRVIGFSNLKPEEFSNKFGIPKRTVENWTYGANEPTEYLLGMLAKEVAEYVQVNDIWGFEGRNV